LVTINVGERYTFQANNSTALYIRNAFEADRGY